MLDVLPVGVDKVVKIIRIRALLTIGGLAAAARLCVRVVSGSARFCRVLRRLRHCHGRRGICRGVRVGDGSSAFLRAHNKLTAAAEVLICHSRHRLRLHLLKKSYGGGLGALDARLPRHTHRCAVEVLQLLGAGLVVHGAEAEDDEVAAAEPQHLVELAGQARDEALRLRIRRILSGLGSGGSSRLRSLVNLSLLFGASISGRHDHDNVDMLRRWRGNADGEEIPLLLRPVPSIVEVLRDEVLSAVLSAASTHRVLKETIFFFRMFVSGFVFDCCQSLSVRSWTMRNKFLLLFKFPFKKLEKSMPMVAVRRSSTTVLN